jgi:catechol 2,3-dioxygenase-like lactoylglutathione lyase family enzyme
MNSTQTRREQATRIPGVGKVDTKLEVVVIPVSDVDRAKRFYGGLGWRLDADFAKGGDFRVVQLTPPGSKCSIIFGTGITAAVPGSTQGLMLIVEDVVAARAELVGYQVDVSEVFHDEGGVFHHAGAKGRVPGPDPEGRSYCTWASFSDPDGNGWLLQEITTRLPGRVAPEPTDRGGALEATTLGQFLQEAEKRHGAYQATAPKHHWSRWYAGYIVARERGRSPDEAEKDAALQMER